MYAFTFSLSCIQIDYLCFHDIEWRSRGGGGGFGIAIPGSRIPESRPFLIPKSRDSRAIIPEFRIENSSINGSNNANCTYDFDQHLLQYKFVAFLSLDR